MSRVWGLIHFSVVGPYTVINVSYLWTYNKFQLFLHYTLLTATIWCKKLSYPRNRCLDISETSDIKWAALIGHYSIRLRISLEVCLKSLTKSLKHITKTALVKLRKKLISFLKFFKIDFKGERRKQRLADYYAPAWTLALSILENTSHEGWNRLTYSIYNFHSMPPLKIEWIQLWFWKNRYSERTVNTLRLVV